MRQRTRFAVCAATLLFLLPPLSLTQNLEIHYINVGWGGSVFVKGPDGTTVLMEAGNTGDGTGEVVPYLQSIGSVPANGLDYTIAGHQHCDHIGGLDEVINAGYNVRIRNYYNGSSYATSCSDGWNAAAATTAAGMPVVMPVGTQIPLGNGAVLTCVACNGSIIGGGSVSVSDENDRSIAVLIQYGGFDYLWASDLGGGSIDNACTGRSTSQTDVETAVITAISPGGAHPMISAGGIDLLHCNHHGSESSTNKNWMNMANPAVAMISVGAGQTSGWDLPRIDVVEHVLLAQATSCITVPATLPLQTEEGSPSGSLMSFAAYCVGDAVFSTDGVSAFTVSADGQVNVGSDERAAAGLPRSFALDDGGAPPDITPPVISNVAASGITASGAQIGWTTDEASTSVVEYGLTTSYGSTVTDNAAVTGHSIVLSGLSANAVYHYRVSSADAWGNTAVDVDHSFQTGGSFTYPPSSAIILQGSLNAGSPANLGSNDASYYVVNSTTSGTRVTDWYANALISQAPGSVSSLTVTYDGKYSRSVTQSLYLYNWVTASWTQISSRTVGTSDATITAAPNAPGSFISAGGEIRLRCLGTGAKRNFTCSADFVRFEVQTPGSSISKEAASTTVVDRPLAFALRQNFPNPFNPTTTIRYDLAQASKVVVAIYDLLGARAGVLVDAEQAPGTYDVRFDASALSSGFYYYRLTAVPREGGGGVYVETRKLLIVK